MPQQAQDLWAPDLVGGEIATPVTILKQQASLLGQKTGNVLEGEVLSISGSASAFAHGLYIVAPALANYRYELLRIFHNIELYPVTALFRGAQSTLNSEAEFVDWLKKTLSSEETKRVVNALLAQSRS